MSGGESDRDTGKEGRPRGRGVMVGGGRGDMRRAEGGKVTEAIEMRGEER